MTKSYEKDEGGTSSVYDSDMRHSPIYKRITYTITSGASCRPSAVFRPTGKWFVCGVSAKRVLWPKGCGMAKKMWYGPKRVMADSVFCQNEQRAMVCAVLVFFLIDLVVFKDVFTTNKLNIWRKNSLVYFIGWEKKGPQPWPKQTF